MKKLLLSLLLLLQYSNICLAKTHNSNFQLYLESGKFFSRQVCPENKGLSEKKIDEIMKEISETWHKENGNKWLEEAEKLIGQNFFEHEFHFTVTNCPFEFWGISAPTIFNIGEDLQKYLEKNDFDNTWLSRINAIIFHEILHRYIDKGFYAGAFKSLNEEYKDENEMVKAHIHLFAIEQYIYKTLKQENKLKIIDDMYKSGKDYPRAWQIVNEKGYKFFIDELKLNKSKGLNNYHWLYE